MFHKILSLTAFLAASCLAAPLALVSDGYGNIAQVNVATGAITGAVYTGVAFTDIAYSQSGLLYGVSFNGLYQLNPSTGAISSFIGPLSYGDANALVVSPTGTLYAAGSVTGGLYTINPSTGATTYVGNTGFLSGGDLAFMANSLYMSTANDIYGNSELVTVNPTTGAATLVGDLGIANVYGLASPDGENLYAFSNESVYSVDPTTAKTTFLSSWAGNTFGFGLAYGATFAPAPEPSMLTLIAGSAAASSWALRRRRI